MQPLAGDASLAEFVIEQLAGQQCSATTRDGSGAERKLTMAKRSAHDEA
jgi:hypothetical protein